MSRRSKQRRASHSPQNPEGNGRTKGKRASSASWLLKGGMGLLLLLLVVALGGSLWVRGYLRSEEFREQLGSQIGSAVGGKAEVGAIEWHGTAMDVEVLTVESPKAGDWQLRDVDADIDLSGFWDKVWIVPSIEIRQARSEWDFRSKETVVEHSPKTPRMSSAPSKRAGFLPNRTEVNEVVVLDYEGEVRLQSGDYSWNGVRLRTEPNSQLATLIELEGGRLQTPFDWLGTMKLESGMMTLRNGEVILDRSQWETDAGPLEFSGDLVADEPGYHASIEDWKIQPLLPAEWASFLSGRATGSLDWMNSFAEGRVAIEDGTVKGLPFIERLAAYAGTPRLRRLSFEEASAEIGRKGETWELKNIVLFDEGLLRIEGYLFKRPEGPAGNLKLGVPPGLLAHIPGAEEKVFLPGKDGLLWTTVRISGTWENPEEDLSERMIRAAGERMFEMIPETGQWALRYGTQAIDEGTSVLLENQGVVLEQGTQVVEEVLEQGGDVVEEGLKTGIGILNGILGGDE